METNVMLMCVGLLMLSGVSQCEVYTKLETIIAEENI
jgi:hypothetical protein